MTKKIQKSNPLLGLESQKGFSIIFSIFLILCFAFTLPSEARSNPLSEINGTWKYTVKVKNTTLFNPEGFLKNEYENKNNKRHYSGSLELKPEDTFYTGYFSFGKEKYQNREIIGSYYPNVHSNPVDYAPIKILGSQASNDEYEIRWLSNFKEKSIGQENTYWLAKGNYKKGTNKMDGYTVALNCEPSKDCNVINVVRWQAKRIPDVRYYSFKHHRWMPLISKILSLIDPSRTIEKFLFNKFLNQDRIKIYSSNESNWQPYIKTPIKALLPVLAAGTEPDPALTAICDPAYCSKTARFWPQKPPGQPTGQDVVAKGSTAQERVRNAILIRQKYCEEAVAGRRSLCCNSMSNGGGENIGSDGKSVCNCRMQTTGSPSSATCCRSFSTCQDEKTTRNEITGSIKVTKENFEPITSYEDRASIAGLDTYYARNDTRAGNQSFVVSNVTGIASDLFKIETACKRIEDCVFQFCKLPNCQGFDRMRP
ncbi:MAG: hypothetical protein QNJ31_05685 [Candidatus Caenarcaniphilales bacterium]|nr:hypothetical protein [Candidatus Caenarcaniphilales bacterium]